MTRANIVLAVVAVCLALALGWVLAKGNPWKQKAIAAEQGQAVATETGRITERTLTKETVIYKQAEAAADDIERAQGADEAVPADVLAGFRAGVGGLRERPDR